VSSDALSPNLARLHALRADYTRGGLHEADASHDPFVQFQHWLDEAIHGGVCEVNAATLSTAALSGAPCSRIVLVKDYTPAGFTFFTNYLSRKGRELAENPLACLHFFWKELERQVLVEGRVKQAARPISEAYFALRPRDAQLGAWASEQSTIIEDGRTELEARMASVTTRFEGQDVPCPPHWGGYLLEPTRFEFWQGRPNRLHDRLVYRLDGDGWRIARLSP